MLLRTGVGGVVTCLCVDVTADGHVILANAGHLAPYLRGEEISIAAGLPLGLNTQSSDMYRQLALTLAPSNTLTLISDGVGEARSSIGDLIGFERTRVVSNQTADQIARTAEQFGQEDDITVMTLTRLKPGEVSSNLGDTSVGSRINKGHDGVLNASWRLRKHPSVRQSARFCSSG